jgi:hypothetical protein
MLTEEEKIRIQEEEIFRQEVRRHLEEQKPSLSRGQKLWEIFNKPFVLWALSTLLIGLISWMYSSYQARVKELAERKETTYRIDVEVRNRIDATLEDLEGVKRAIQRGSKIWSPADAYDTAWRGMNRMPGSQAAAANFGYPEYRNKDFQSLITELNGLVSIDERPDLDRATKTLEQLKNRSMEADTNGSEPEKSNSTEASVKATEQVTQVINENILIPRWRNIKR